MSVGRVFLITALCALLSAPAFAQSIPIIVEDFDGNALDSAVWDAPGTGAGGAGVAFGRLELSAQNGGTRFLRPTKPSFATPFRFAPSATLPLVLTVRIGGSVDGSSWGLAVDTDRTNAIEFAIHEGNLYARSVTNGSVTETLVPVFGVADPPPYWPPVFYSIIAYPGLALFSINGQPVALHTTNVPTVTMNPLFFVPSAPGQNFPSVLVIDNVSFSRR